MANFANSIGYKLERLHSGMLVYLCELWNEGNIEPLESILDELRLPGILSGECRKLSAQLEYKNIDFVMFVENKPLLAMEMKVDSHEKDNVKRKNGKKDYQTLVYPERVPECEHFLFVTLGLGEYYRAPQNKCMFKWVRTEDFLQALEAISETDFFIEDWRKAVREEKEFKDRCRRGKPNNDDFERARDWNVYFLGFLKEYLEESLPTKLGENLTTYPYSSSDTILNFGWEKYPYYMEINTNGSLNLKANLEDLDSKERKEEVLKKAQKYYSEFLGSTQAECKAIGENPKKTRTIMSFNIGIEKQSKKLFAHYDESETYANIREIIEKFYGSVPPPKL